MEERLEQPERWVRRQVIPFAVFMGFLLLLEIAAKFFAVDLPSQPWWRKAPEQWLYPLQTITCLLLLIWWWKSYEFKWSLKPAIIGAVAGAVGIGFWILPTHLYDALNIQGDGWWTHFGVVERNNGFNPGDHFAEGGAAWWSALIMRFMRAAVVVALVEEIFWRSFVMRLTLNFNGDYWKQPFGKPSWLSYLIVTGLFIFAHGAPDRPAAFIYGSLTYAVCVWTKNLGACVIMHAVANLLMGLYAMGYGKYGLW